MSYLPGAYFNAAGALAPEPEPPRSGNERVLPLVGVPAWNLSQTASEKRRDVDPAKKAVTELENAIKGSGTHLHCADQLWTTLVKTYHVEEYSQEWAKRLLTAFGEGLRGWNTGTSVEHVVSGLFFFPLQHRLFLFRLQHRLPG